jgi:hypothetical protein
MEHINVISIATYDSPTIFDMQNKTTLTSYSLLHDNFFYKGQQLQHMNDITNKRF